MDDISAFNQMIFDAQNYVTPECPEFDLSDIGKSINEDVDVNTQSLLHASQWSEEHIISEVCGLFTGISYQHDQDLRSMTYEQQLYWLICAKWQTAEHRQERERLRSIMQSQQVTVPPAFNTHKATNAAQSPVPSQKVEIFALAPFAYHHIPIMPLNDTNCPNDINHVSRASSFADRYDPIQTHDQALFELYTRVAENPDRNVRTLLRLQLQKGHWTWLINGLKRNEYQALNTQCKDLIALLKVEDKTVSSRAAEYLFAKLNQFPALDENLQEIPIHTLLSYWYQFVVRDFINPKPLNPPQHRGPFQVNVVTYIKWRGGEPLVLKPLELSRSLTYTQLKTLLRDHTSTIQSKQLGCSGGFEGSNWLYTEDVISDWATFKPLEKETDWKILKQALREDFKVTIIHKTQCIIRRELLKVDAAHFGVLVPRNNRPLTLLPPGYSPAVAPAYPYSGVLPALARDVGVFEDLHLVQNRRGRKGQENWKVAARRAKYKGKMAGKRVARARALSGEDGDEEDE